MLVELLNSAVEAVVDRFGLERHELAGKAKDLGSASVFSAIMLAIAVWVLSCWRDNLAVRIKSRCKGTMQIAAPRC
jgi:diacylglycerol kinase (ATP)